MKKMTVRIPSTLLACCLSCAPVFERFEVISLLNVTPDSHSEVCRFTLKEGIPPDAAKCNIISEMIVLRNEGYDYTCLIRGTFSDELSRFIRTYDLKLEYPIVFTDDACTFSMIGTSEELNAIMSASQEKGWDFEILSIVPYDPHISCALNTLTGRQREVLTRAYHAGFFDHPRKIDAEKLAGKLGMHKSTLLTHIHKAEKRLIGHILEQSV